MSCQPQLYSSHTLTFIVQKRCSNDLLVFASIYCPERAAYYDWNISQDWCNNTIHVKVTGCWLNDIYEVLYGLNGCNPRVKQIPPVAVRSHEACWWHELSIINQTRQQSPAALATLHTPHTHTPHTHTHTHTPTHTHTRGILIDLPMEVKVL